MITDNCWKFKTSLPDFDPKMNSIHLMGNINKKNNF